MDDRAKRYGPAKIDQLDRLDFFAGMALQGLLARSSARPGGNKVVCREAVELGGEMIVALCDYKEQK